MKFIKRILSINTVILGFAIFCIVVFVQKLIESSDDFDKLVKHQGIVIHKSISFKYFSKRNSFTKSYEQDSVEIFNFSVVDDPTLYTASSHVHMLNNLLGYGDSIEFYTKGEISRGGNTVTDKKSRSWTTTSLNEVFHVSTKTYGTLMDFQEHKKGVQDAAWASLFMSFLLVGWYLYRRSGIKSPFVYESSG
jgi:hypothetical protein